MRYFAAHPTAANLLMLVLIVAGLSAAPQLQRETFPRVQPSEVEVRAVYPGARPEDVELAVCERVEDATDAIDNVLETRCEAREGVAIAVVKMREGADLDRFTTDISTEIDAIDDFPAEVEQPTVRQLGRTDFVTSVAVTATASDVDLKAYADNLKTRMLRFGGIPKAEVRGFSDAQIRIELFDAALRQLDLGVADVADAIARQSVDLPAGSIVAGDGEVLLRLADRRRRADAFADVVVVSASAGGVVRLGDIASISRRFELDEEKVLFNGQQAAIIDITKTESDDTLEVVDAVTAFLAAERERAPPGVALTITNNLSSLVRDRLGLLLRNGGQGLVLVLLTLWLFFGFRYAFWVAAGLPISFLGATMVMVAAGYTINMMTMVGLLIVIGLLMDDAIVIAENIATQRARGKPPVEAAVDGARQVWPSVFASFATTTCVFGSLAFIGGDIGQILRVVPVVMLFVLAVSLVEAFLVLPHHLAHVHAGAHGSVLGGRVQQWVERATSEIRDRVVVPLAVHVVRWRYAFTGSAVALLLLAAATLVGGVLKFSPFPALDGDVMEARVLLPQGSPLARTEAVVERLLVALDSVREQLDPRQPQGRELVSNVTVKFNHNSDANESGRHVATVVVDLLGSEQRGSDIDDVIALWRSEFGVMADVVSVKFTEAALGPAGYAIDMRLAGEDLVTLKAAALALRAWLDGYAGTSNVTDDLRPGKPEVRVRLKDSATPLGVNARMIADQLRSAFHGQTVDEVSAGGESVEVDVRLARADRDSLSDLDYFSISVPGGGLVPLAEVADFDTQRGYSRINRVNGMRTVTVRGDVDSAVANAGEVVANTVRDFVPTLARDFPGVRLSLEGENSEAAETQASMVRGFILGLVGVFALLSLQFRSYVEPLVVMAIIPFAFTGAVAGHLLLGLDFTMPSMLGFVALAGVVVNDSILLVNFIKHYHGETQSVAEAAPLATRARFRAILLTSLTTVAGLLPLLFETSLQAQILIPLVASLAFGLIATTVLVLFIVPAIYAIVDDLGFAQLD